jgi:hypothetical protein
VKVELIAGSEHHFKNMKNGNGFDANVDKYSLLHWRPLPVNEKSQHYEYEDHLDHSKYEDHIGLQRRVYSKCWARCACENYVKAGQFDF